MSETRTPGQVAYEAYQAALPERLYYQPVAWDARSLTMQAAWEAAAQAVLAQCTPQKDTP